MMKNNYFKSLLFAAVCLLANLTASAQFSAKVDQVPRSDWAPEPATFNISEVAEALGTDATTLLNALDSWIAEGSTDPNMFFYAAPSAPDTWADGYTTGGEKGFWISEDAEIINFPDGAYYCNPVWSADEGTFSINIGMMPDALKYGVYNKELKFALQYGGKTATFTIDFTVTGIEKVDIPEPATVFESKLNIVGEKEITIEQYPRTSYDADQVSMVVEDIIEKLGIPSGTVLQNYMGELLYSTRYDTETVNKLDSLSNESTAGAPGFWFTDIRVNGEATGECAATDWGGGDYFFMESFGFDPESNTITCNFGQYPGKCKGDEKLFANLYIIYGDKAYRLIYRFNVLVKEEGNGMEDYTKVGEYAATVKLEISANSYLSVPFTIDVATIAEALGCEVSELTVKALDDTDNFATSTGERGGFWFNAEGAVVTWSADGSTGNTVFVNPDSNEDFSSVAVGQLGGSLTEGQPVTVHLYFFNGPEGDKYYDYSIIIDPYEPKQIEGEFENVRTISFAVLSTVTDNHTCDRTWSIAPSVIEDAIGTVTGAKLFTLAKDDVAEEAGSIYTSDYSCTPYPGFWLDADGRRTTYGGPSPVGVTYVYSTGTFTFWQYPGAVNVGDVFHFQLFVVNPENNKMITFNISLSFVNEIVEAEVVGSEDITLPVSMNEAKGTIDLSAAAEALGVSVDELLEGEYLCGMMESGLYTEGALSEDGLAFNKDGFFDQVTPAVSFNIVKEGDDVVVTAWSEEELAEDFRLSTQFCYQIDNKQYIFNVKFVSVAAYTGIANIRTADKTDGKIYDLSGREVRQPARGIYIQNGRKFIK